MARTRTRAATAAATKGDDGVQAAVLPADAPKLIVEVLPDTHFYHEGKLIEPGQTCELDIGCATNAVVLRHGKIIGTVEP